MSIEFAQLDDAAYQGSLQANLPAISTVFTADYATALRSVIPPTLIGEFLGQTDEIIPEFNGFDALISPGLVGQFAGNYVATGTLDLTLPALRTSFYDGARVVAELPAITTRFSNASPTFLSAQPVIEVQIAAQFEAPTLTEDVIFSTSMAATMAVVFESIANFRDDVWVIAELQATIESSVVAADMFQVVFQGRVTSDIVVELDSTAVLRMVYLLADQLTITDEAVGFYNALVTVASAIVMGDTVTPGLDGRLESEFEITDEMVAKINALIEVIAELVMEDSLEPSLHLFATLDDAFQLTDDQTLTVAMLAEILDTANLTFRVTTDAGDVYVGYSINTRTAAASEYQNYPFNSMAVIGGVPYGAGPDGIYRLTGDTDDSAPIHASVYTGLTDFGSSYLKQLPAAWIGLTSEGEMVLKVVTTDKGRKKENWYRMKARPHGAPVDSRFSPAKGLEGRYWGFKLENVDGANFQLDSLKMWPLAMKRRYSGR